jgi:lipopolysaccharide export system protein LptA
MAGNVRLNRGGDTLNGGRLVIDLRTGISSVDGRADGSSSVTGAVGGSGNGRVSGSFSVPQGN